MKTVLSVLCFVALSTLCAGTPADPEVDPDHDFFQARPDNTLLVCVNMTPIHGDAVVQTGPSPYSVLVDKTTVVAGDIVYVTLNGTIQFRGIFMEAREGETPVGEFLEEQAFRPILVDCAPGKATAVHYRYPAPGINHVTFRWRAPSTPGTVVFRSTFVETFSVFWVAVPSVEVHVVARQ